MKNIHTLQVGCTALIAASAYGKVEMVQYLLTLEKINAEIFTTDIVSLKLTSLATILTILA